ncbi:MAG: hypothetical protein O2797_06245 [Bacteroidetes bacterium]|nr:hypothetical protein [Bacteroidota bacterium]
MAIVAMRANGDIGLHRDSVLGLIAGQSSTLRYFVFWRFVSAVLVAPFPVITRHIVDIDIPADDSENVILLTAVALGLLLLHFVTRALIFQSA